MVAKFTPHPKPETLNIPTVLGTAESMPSPGYVSFQLPGSGPLRWSSWQAGLHFLDGDRKPYVYEAFSVPVFVRALSGNRVEIFGGRRALSSGSAQIESKAPGGSYRSLGTATLNEAGYFRRVFKVNSAARRKYRVTLDGISRVKSPVNR